MSLVSSISPIAFLIPTRNRHECLRKTLLSVVPAAAAVHADIIICDQSPTPFPSRDGIHVFHLPNLSGLPAARVFLLHVTQAPIICFLDDDMDIASDFAVILQQVALQEPHCHAWGPVIERRSLPIRRLHRMVHLGAFKDPRRLQAGPNDHPTWALFGCCFAVRRDTALRIGFDTRRPGYALGEDLDFFMRLRNAVSEGRCSNTLAPFCRFVSRLQATHRQDGQDRSSPQVRGLAKGAFIRWWASRHGGQNMASPLHVGLAVLAAASGLGQESAHWQGVLKGFLSRRTVKNS